MTIKEKRQKLTDIECTSNCEQCEYDCADFCGKNSEFSAPDNIIDAWYEKCFGANNALPNNVNHPSHYQGKHECIDEMIKLFGVQAVIGFCKCNVYKYRYRADRKGGEEDIKKAEWYMDKLIELESKIEQERFKFLT